jgi:hypothetical protein
VVWLKVVIVSVNNSPANRTAAILKLSLFSERGRLACQTDRRHLEAVAFPRRVAAEFPGFPENVRNFAGCAIFLSSRSSGLPVGLLFAARDTRLTLK